MTNYQKVLNAVTNVIPSIDKNFSEFRQEIFTHELKNNITELTKKLSSVIDDQRTALKMFNDFIPELSDTMHQALQGKLAGAEIPATTAPPVLPAIGVKSI